MEVRTKILAPEVLLEEYAKLLREDPEVGELPLVISGNSMSPFLIGGRDTVWLSRVDRPLQVGDAVLYRRKSGSYVFHRIYRICDNCFTMIGDAQTVLESGIEPEQIIAVMTRAERKGKLLMPGDFWWFFFEKVWIRMIPLRRIVARIYSSFWKLSGKEKRG